MSPRTASRALSMVPVSPPLAAAAAPPAPDSAFEALDWQGEVRLSSERAAGTSAAAWQAQVRAGLLERLVVLGAEHRTEPHRGRPDVLRRLLAHVDALAEAGLSLAEMATFAEEVDTASPGVLWAFTVLFGCLDTPGAEGAFEAWIASLDEALFDDYGRVVEIAEALGTQPNPSLRALATGWGNDRSPVLRAISMEVANPADLGGSLGARAEAEVSPFGLASFERLLARRPDLAPSAPRPSWMDVDIPSIAFEIARARVLRGDPEPLARVRDRHPRALAALGPFAMDLIALAGDGADGELARDLALGLPTTPALLDAMGRAGLPALFPRLLAELAGDDFDDDARRALCTVLGPRSPEGGAARSPKTWEEAIACLATAGATSSGVAGSGASGGVAGSGASSGVAGSGASGGVPAGAGRFRGGQPWSLGAVMAEVQRPDLSAEDVRVRADEVFARTGKTTPIDWDAPGVSLEAAFAALARLLR